MRLTTKGKQILTVSIIGVLAVIGGGALFYINSQDNLGATDSEAGVVGGDDGSTVVNPDPDPVVDIDNSGGGNNNSGDSDNQDDLSADCISKGVGYELVGIECKLVDPAARCDALGGYWEDNTCKEEALDYNPNDVITNACDVHGDTNCDGVLNLLDNSDSIAARQCNERDDTWCWTGLKCDICSPIIPPSDTINPNNAGGGDIGSTCGNGTVETGESCDDGNTTNGDGCSSACTIEVAGTTCGNNILETGESCDDGNLTNGDGCSSACTVELQGAICGNNTVEIGEECDGTGNACFFGTCNTDCTCPGNPDGADFRITKKDSVSLSADKSYATVVYTVTLVNQGALNGEAIRIVDTVDSRMQSDWFIATSVSPSTGFSRVNNVLTWTLSDTLATFSPGEQVNFQYSYKVPSSAFGSFTNIARGYVTNLPDETLVIISAVNVAYIGTEIPDGGLFDSFGSRVITGFALITFAGVAFYFERGDKAFINIFGYGARLSARNSKIEKRKSRFEKKI